MKETNRTRVAWGPTHCRVCVSPARPGRRGSAINSTSAGSWTVHKEAPSSGVDPNGHVRGEGLAADCASGSTEDSWNKQQGSFSAPPDVRSCVIPAKTVGHGEQQPSQSSSPAGDPANVPESPRNVPAQMSIPQEPVRPGPNRREGRLLQGCAHSGAHVS